MKISLDPTLTFCQTLKIGMNLIEIDKNQKRTHCAHCNSTVVLIVVALSCNTQWAIVVKNHIFSERRQEMEHGEIFSPDLLITK